MVRMKSKIKPSDVYTLAIGAVAHEYNRHNTVLTADELADALAYLCNERDTALYVEQREAEAATKAKAEECDEGGADHVEN